MWDLIHLSKSTTVTFVPVTSARRILCIQKRITIVHVEIKVKRKTTNCVNWWFVSIYQIERVIFWIIFSSSSNDGNKNKVLLTDTFNLKRWFIIKWTKIDNKLISPNFHQSYGIRIFLKNYWELNLFKKIVSYVQFLWNTI